MSQKRRRPCQRKSRKQEAQTRATREQMLEPLVGFRLNEALGFFLGGGFPPEGIRLEQRLHISVGLLCSKPHGKIILWHDGSVFFSLSVFPTASHTAYKDLRLIGPTRLKPFASLCRADLAEYFFFFFVSTHFYNCQAQPLKPHGKCPHTLK